MMGAAGLSAILEVAYKSCIIAIIGAVCSGIDVAASLRNAIEEVAGEGWSPVLGRRRIGAGVREIYPGSATCPLTNRLTRSCAGC
jgi:hypothetical protein